MVLKERGRVNLCDQPLCFRSSDTVSFLRPRARLAANTLLPLAVAIRSLKPCLFLRLRCEG